VEPIVQRGERVGQSAERRTGQCTHRRLVRAPPHDIHANLVDIIRSAVNLGGKRSLLQEHLYTTQGVRVAMAVNY